MTGRRPPGRPARVAVSIGRSPEGRYSLHRGYVDALVAIGAVPVVVPAGPGVPADAALSVLADCDALLLSGGGDVHPATYAGTTGPGPAGEGPVGDMPASAGPGGAGAAGEVAAMAAAMAAACKEVDRARDEVELALLGSARSSGKRVLGICRGAQLLAAGLGGRLVLDLPSSGHDGHWRADAEGRPVHPVEADTGSLAGHVLGGAGDVNSIHHQAVDHPGPELRVTALSADGVVEAVETDGVLGVQWHPERMAAADPRHLAAFCWLVET